jgi:hypothetical protein
MRAEHNLALSDPQRAQGQAGGVGAIEDVIDREVREFAMCPLDQGTPPAAAGEQGGAGRREKGYRLPDGEYRARICQSVDDDRRILLDVQGFARFEFMRHVRWGEQMASDSEDPDTSADRLEAALERIAQAAVREETSPTDQIPSPETEEIAARLDGLIDRLRAALGEAS